MQRCPTAVEVFSCWVAVLGAAKLGNKNQMQLLQPCAARDLCPTAVAYPSPSFSFPGPIGAAVEPASRHPHQNVHGARLRCARRGGGGRQLQVRAGWVLD